MKELLVSIKPYFYYLIGEGIKKIEVRKNKPMAVDWNKKVLLYMSKDEKSFSKIPEQYQDKYHQHFGEIGLCFICDKLIEYNYILCKKHIQLKCLLLTLHKLV